VAIRDHVVGQEWYLQRADEARVRAAEARQAAERARERIAELHQTGRVGPIGPSLAEERRLLAEERLAQVEASLAEARQRSVNAHERAARLDASTGRGADAQRHRVAADDDRQLIEDEAVRVAQRRNDATTQRRNDATTQRRNDATTQRRNVTLQDLPAHTIDSLARRRHRRPST
jgi:hypothetical protein